MVTIGGISSGVQIVTTGLQLWLDAAQKRSYAGSGTTWTNLTGNANATLTNGPTFDSGAGGNIVFDGTDDYAIASAVPMGANSTTIFSVTMWVYFEGILNSNRMLVKVGNSFFALNSNSGLLLALDNFNASASTSNFIWFGDTWNHFAVRFNKDVTPRGRGYVNGTGYDISISNFQTGNGSTADVNIARNSLFIDYGNIKVSQIQTYSTALTDAEVLQNYNADKSRYGL